MEPLAFFLPKVVKYPSIGNPVVEELVGTLRATAHGTADEAIDRAADVIRYGDRTNLVVVFGRSRIGRLAADEACPSINTGAVIAGRLARWRLYDDTLSGAVRYFQAQAQNGAHHPP